MNIEEMTLKIRADISEIQNMGDRIAAEFRKVREAIAKASEASDDLLRRARRMGQSMGQAARSTQSSMGKAAQSTTTFDRKIENLKRRILDLIRSNRSISEMGVQFRRVGRMAQSAATTIRSGFGQIGSVLSKAKNKISELIQKIRSIGPESRNAGNQASRSMDQIGGSASRAANQANAGFGRLSSFLKGGLAILLGGGAILAITRFGKSCVDLGSDLAEVQNVVDTTFPSMNAQIDQFSKGAIEQFGLSETVAKKYASTFGAMARAFGFTEQQAYDMGTALTGLSGDVASFYNISTDEAYTKLKSVFTGETETLKDLGVVMTQNALDQYALQNGYARTTAQMTEQEKVALRLAFVQEKLSLASGDFAKTADSWANQVRVLKLRFDSLKATLGQGLINLLTPVIKVINSIIAKLSVLAEAFLRFTERITGKKMSNPVGNVAADMGTASGATKDYSDAAQKAGDSAEKSGNRAEAAAKKIKRSVMGFDKLNKLNEKPQADSGSTGSGGSGGAGVGGAGLVGAMDELTGANQKLSESAKRLAETLKRLKEIAKPTTDAIKKLWNEGLKKLGDFTWDTIKDFWNNFLKPMGVWMLNDNSGLPRFFNITNDLLNEIDWNRLNRSLERLFLALQKPAKFTWNALMDFYEHFLKPVAVWTMGKGIPQLVDALTDLVNLIDWERLNKALANLWKALVPFAINVGQGLVNFFKDFTHAVGNFINGPGIGAINGLAKAIKKISPETAQKLGYAIGILATGFFAFKGLGKVASIISSLSKPVVFLASNLVKFGSKVVGLFGEGSTVAGIFAEGGLFGKGGAIATALGSVGAPIVAVIGTIALVVAAFVDLWKTSKTFRKNIKEVFSGIGKAFGDLKKAIWDDTLKPLVKQVKDAFKDLYDAYEESGLKTLVEINMVAAFKVLGKIIELALKSFAEFVRTVGSKISDVIRVFQGFIEILGGVAEIIQGVFTLDTEKILGGFEEIGEGILDIFSGVVGFFDPSGLIDNLYEAVGKIKPIKLAVSLVKKGWSSLTKFVGNIGVKAFKLGKLGWKTISSFVGEIGTKAFKLGKLRWTTIANFVGDIGTKAFSLGRKGWTTLSGFINGFGSGLNIGAKVKLIQKWSGSVAKFFGLDKIFKLAIKLPRIGINWGSSKVAGFKINYPTGFYVKYAKGGFPGNGQLFMANEAGPEMIGKMGRQNVVANNMQITNGIRDAVVDAMVQVLMNSGAKEDAQVIIENKFMVDSETFYKMTQKGKLKADRRYHVLATI